MSASYESRQPASPNSEQPAAPASARSTLQHALVRALAEGPGAIGTQIQTILALCRLNGDVPPVSAPYVEPVISVEHARLMALVQTTEVLPESRVKKLVREALQVKDLAVRLQLLARLALYLPPSNYSTVVRDMWQQAHNLPDPVLRARVLFQLSPLMTLAQDEPATPGALLDVLALAQSINHTESRVRSLVALAPHLPLVIQLRTLSRVLDEVDALHHDTLTCNIISTIADNLPADLEERVLRSAMAITAAAERARALTLLARVLPEDRLVTLREQTLDAISSIEQEDARAQALIAFAPYLEYAVTDQEFPVLLQIALALAVNMNKRQIRARVLVALAAHLPRDLQGEALAAVHSLSSERERAELLTALAPSLPPDMLVASLAVAHTMQEQDARMQALTVLAHHLPAGARVQTALDALATASGLPHQFERVTALLALVDILPPDLQERAFISALETAQHITNENTRARALSALAPHLPPPLLTTALESAQALKSLQLRLTTVISMIPFLPAEQRFLLLQDTLERISEISFDYKRARTLVSIAPLLPAELAPRAQALAEAIQDVFDRVTACIALAQNLPPADRPAIIARTWTEIKNIENGYDQASALAAIAPFLPAAASEDLARRAGMVIGAIMDDYDQASAISILAPLLTAVQERGMGVLPSSFTALREGLQLALRVPQQALRLQLLEQGMRQWTELFTPEQSYELWRELVPTLTTLPQADALLGLGVMMNTLHHLAGEAGIQDVARVILQQ